VWPASVSRFCRILAWMRLSSAMRTSTPAIR
jgi:hypothetical protein